MEVHNHTHTARKKWTHYFWEFFMLFLAVFCGFLAENIREHKIEHQRAKELATSLYADFMNDSAHLKDILIIRKEWEDILDTLMNELEKPMALQNDTTIFVIAGNYLSKRVYFVPTTGTYEQIKQSGYLRYFKQDVAFNLVKYESALHLLSLQLDLENKFVLENIVPFTTKNINQKYLRTPDLKQDGLAKEALVTKNPVFQNELYGQARFLQARSRIYLSTLKGLDSLSDVCINLLKKEYHLQ
jgi:hypothetical protein